MPSLAASGSTVALKVQGRYSTGVKVRAQLLFANGRGLTKFCGSHGIFTTKIKIFCECPNIHIHPLWLLPVFVINTFLPIHEYNFLNQECYLTRVDILIATSFVILNGRSHLLGENSIYCCFSDLHSLMHMAILKLILLVMVMLPILLM